MPDGSYPSAADVAPSHTILDRLPPDVLGSLTVEQRAAIAVASGDWKNGFHRVNIRLSLPLLPKRWYITVLGGPERRKPPAAGSSGRGTRCTRPATWHSFLSRR
jgi:hypothetical protein